MFDQSQLDASQRDSFAVLHNAFSRDEVSHASVAADTAGPAGTHPDIRRRVLITGAGGNIGSRFAKYARERYDLRLMVQHEGQATSELRACGEVVAGDLLDLARMKDLCRDIDTVVHLAADPDPSATWSRLLPTNIVGTYHTFVAAKAAGCRRLIFASSIHAVSGYPPDVQIHTHDPVNPGDLYGVSKCFGEALGRYMAEQEGLSAIVLRIGAYAGPEAVRTDGSIGALDAWISRRDLHHLIERCIEVEHLPFAILHAVSNNRYKRLDISDARRLVGYAPQDDLAEEHPGLKRLKLGETLIRHNLSGGQRSGLLDEL